LLQAQIDAAVNCMLQAVSIEATPQQRRSVKALEHVSTNVVDFNSKTIALILSSRHLRALFVARQLTQSNKRRGTWRGAFVAKWSEMIVA